MKFGKLFLVGATAFLSLTASAQDEDRECLRVKLFANNAIMIDSNYKVASANLLKMEVMCPDFDQKNWNQLIGCLLTVISTEKEEPVKKLYMDTLLAAFERQEAAGLYEERYDFTRGLYLTQASVPNAKIADKYFQRGIKSQGLKTPESYIIYAYYATYLMYTDAKGEELAQLKKRMISDYFEYSEMVNKGGMSAKTQETLTQYLNYVVQDCASLLPEIDGYIKTLPEDKDAAILAIQRMMTLLSDRSCADSKEYKALNAEWLKRDPNCIPCLFVELASKNGNEAISILKDIMSKTDDPELKAKCQYEIAFTQFKMGSYQAAYASGRACTGKYKADGMYIAAQCVAKTANSCGDSTFERKCNYIYAAQLADQAGQSGAAATYRASAPTSAECFNENSPKSVTLSCWGVTVNPCP